MFKMTTYVKEIRAIKELMVKSQLARTIVSGNQRKKMIYGNYTA